jgi:hypothetical protein
VIKLSRWRAKRQSKPHNSVIITLARDRSSIYIDYIIGMKRVQLRCPSQQQQQSWPLTTKTHFTSGSPFHSLLSRLDRSHSHLQILVRSSFLCCFVNKLLIPRYLLLPLARVTLESTATNFSSLSIHMVDFATRTTPTTEMTRSSAKRVRKHPPLPRGLFFKKFPIILC